MIKKLLLLGFGLTLLIGLPLVLFVLQNQTHPQSSAAAVTKFSFTVPSNANVGQNFDASLVVDPGGQNQVSFVKFTFTYDPTKLDKASNNPVTIDTNTYTVLEPAQVTCTDSSCQVSATLSVGQNQNAIIKSSTTVATIHFIAKANTDPNTPTQLVFVDGQNQALSVGSSDQAAENVFQSGTPASITIGNSSPTGAPAPTSETGTTGGGGQTGGTGGTTGGSGTGNSGNVSVSCTSFTADNTLGAPPLTVNFTTVGSSPNDSISNIAINYGDGTVDQVATGSGITTGNVNNQISHTYNTAGTFTASATLTSTGGATSDPSTCKQTITVGSPTASPSANLPPTGPGQTFLLVGTAGAIIGVLGAVVMLGL